jgi:hypothetical protein
MAMVAPKATTATNEVIILTLSTAPRLGLKNICVLLGFLIEIMRQAWALQSKGGLGKHNVFLFWLPDGVVGNMIAKISLKKQ